jgi:hypothetical protein
MYYLFFIVILFCFKIFNVETHTPQPISSTSHSAAASSTISTYLVRNLQAASVTVEWRAYSWDQCTVPCGGGIQRRKVLCWENVTQAETNPSFCPIARPASAQACNTFACPTLSPCPTQDVTEFSCEIINAVLILSSQLSGGAPVESSQNIIDITDGLRGLYFSALIGLIEPSSTMFKLSVTKLTNEGTGAILWSTSALRRLQTVQTKIRIDYQVLIYAGSSQASIKKFFTSSSMDRLVAGTAVGYIRNSATSSGNQGFGFIFDQSTSASVLSPSPTPEGAPKSSSVVSVAAGIGGTVCLLLAIGIYFFYYKKKNDSTKKSNSDRIIESNPNSESENPVDKKSFAGTSTNDSKSEKKKQVQATIELSSAPASSSSSSSSSYSSSSSNSTININDNTLLTSASVAAGAAGGYFVVGVEKGISSVSTTLQTQVDASLNEASRLSNNFSSNLTSATVSVESSVQKGFNSDSSAMTTSSSTVTSEIASLNNRVNDSLTVLRDESQSAITSINNTISNTALVAEGAIKSAIGMVTTSSTALTSSDPRSAWTDSASSSFANAQGNVSSTLSNAQGNFSSTLTNTQDQISSTFSNAQDQISSTYSKDQDQISSTFSDTQGTVSVVASRAQVAANNADVAIRDSTRLAGVIAKNEFNQTTSAASSALSTAANTISGSIKSVAGEVSSDAREAAATALCAAAPIVSAAGNIVSNALEGFIHIVEKSAPALPFVGPALLALTLVYRQTLLAKANTAEITSLTQRLGRLEGLLREASKDELFVTRHQIIFAGLTETLTNAAHTLEIINGRSSIMQFANASSDVLQLKAIDRQLNIHVAEFTAAQTTETLAAVRSLSVRSPEKEKVIEDPYVPPPPFFNAISNKG